MEAPRWRRIQELFDELSDREDADRALLLEREPDATIRHEVAELLAAHEQTGEFLEDVAFEHPTIEDDETFQRKLLAAGRIGPYRIERVLGRGGMGLVFLARQRHPDRPVALKVVRGGLWASERHAVLLEREVSALARLTHPDIARIYDAGSTAEGSPYFTMEVAEGEALDRFVDQRDLSLPERLTLFDRIADAVAYAHQRGVIHCDLKPSNVVLSAREGGLSLKILDFGLARSLGEVMPHRDVAAGSLPSMSPEQTRSEQPVDVRTDVYALGVLLHHLVTGKLPLTLDGLPSADALERIRSRPPDIASRRDIGDLHDVCARALAKNPEDRYASVSELRDDVLRHVGRRPVRARPQTRAYIARRFVGRHRALVASAALAIVILATFVFILARQAHRLEDQKERAERQRAVAEQQRTVAETERALAERVIAWWGQQTLGALSPDVAGDPDVALRDVIRRQSRTLDAEFGEHPRALAQLHGMIGATLRALGDAEGALGHLEPAHTLSAQVFGDEARQTLTTANNLACALEAAGRDADAERIHRRVIALRRRRPEEALRLYASLDNLGGILTRQERLEEATALLSEAYEGRRARLGPTHADTLTSQHNYATLLVRQGELVEAERLFRETLRARKQQFPAKHPKVLSSLANLGRVLLRRGRHGEAHRILRHALRTADETLGEAHPFTLSVSDALGNVEMLGGAVDRAEERLELALDVARDALGESDRTTRSLRLHLAMARTTNGRPLEAIPVLQALLDSVSEEERLDAPIRLKAVHNLAIALDAAGRREDARALLTRWHRRTREELGDDHATTLQFAADLGALLSLEGSFGAAEKLLTRTLAAQGRRHGATHERTLRTRNHRNRAVLAQGRVEEALVACHETSRLLRETLSARNMVTLSALLNEARACRAAGRHDEAATLLEEVSRGTDDLMPGQHLIHCERRREWARTLVEAGRAEEAVALLRRFDDRLGERLPFDTRRLLYGDLATAWDDAGDAEQAARWRRLATAAVP